MGRKSLEEKVNERARELMREFIDAQFAGKQVDAAAAFGVSQPTMSDFLNGNKGMGGKLAGGVAAIDSELAIAMLSGDSPAARAGAMALAMPAIQLLRADGYPLQISTWAVWTAYKLHTADDVDGLIRDARLLIVVAESIGGRSLKSDTDLPAEHIEDWSRGRE